MAKCSFEFKLQLVKGYLVGHDGHKSIAAKYGINPNILLRRINNYQYLGEYSLAGSRQKPVYAFEFKLHVVESYLTSELSYQELALKVGITNPATIVKWVNEHRTAGPEALKPIL